VTDVGTNEGGGVEGHAGECSGQTPASRDWPGPRRSRGGESSRNQARPAFLRTCESRPTFNQEGHYRKDQGQQSDPMSGRAPVSVEARRGVSFSLRSRLAYRIPG
jgi:hypothetical protein